MRSIQLGMPGAEPLTYVLARQRGEPLLCKGDDFAQTDLDLVLPPAPTP